MPDLNSVSVKKRKVNKASWAILGDSYVENLDSFIRYAPSFIGAKISVTVGISGQRSGQLIDDLPLITATDAGNCIVFAGVNDMLQDVSVSTYKSNMRTIITTLQNAGINAHVMMIPTVNTRPTKHTQFNYALFQLSIELDCYLHDVWSDIDCFEANGTWDPSFSSDGVHVNIDKTYLLYQKLCEKISNPSATIPRILTGGCGLFTNPTFVGDSNADGLADSWSINGSGITTTLEAVANGNNQVLTINNATITTPYLYQIKNTTAIRNRRLALIARYSLDYTTSATGIKASIFVRMVGTPNADRYARQYTSVKTGMTTALLEFDGTATATDIFAICQIDPIGTGNKSGVVKIHGFDVLDLTAIGIA